uniref:Uncharacterized protein n=1 Tax=Equus caballus TaxID=9796 RepID=A0A9L0T076_HORSE
MEVFVMICHHKITISGDTKESSPMPELKRLVEGILEWPPAQQRPLMGGGPPFCLSSNFSIVNMHLICNQNEL